MSASNQYFASCQFKFTSINGIRSWIRLRIFWLLNITRMANQVAAKNTIDYSTLNRKPVIPV